MSKVNESATKSGNNPLAVSIIATSKAVQVGEPFDSP